MVVLIMRIIMTIWSIVFFFETLCMQNSGSDTSIEDIANKYSYNVQSYSNDYKESEQFDYEYSPSSEKLDSFSDEEVGIIIDIISAEYEKTDQKTAMFEKGVEVLEKYSRLALEEGGRYRWELLDANHDGFSDLILSETYDIVWNQQVIIAIFDIKKKGDCIYFDDVDMTSFDFVSDNRTIISCTFDSDSLAFADGENTLSIWYVENYSEEDTTKWEDWARRYNVELKNGYNVYFMLESKKSPDNTTDKIDDTYRFISREQYGQLFETMTGTGIETIQEWLN